MTIDVLSLIIAVFATFRVARMIAEEEGPGVPFGSPEQRKKGVFERLRGRFTDDKSWLAKGLRCPHCVGFWMAGVVTGYLVWLGVISLALSPLVWLAVAGAQVKLDQWWKR